ncbi:glycerol-3-phosphate dehydrogenase/oxidase [Paralcaligenes ureilyticus]|uniref:Glycerol-3-phosphate dehydrogenase n=1 Tax=Paralcaligenes ureilyticus TaxID=627131 RepID=A0A4R3M5N2_9BURK|nr:glycerol-3-phosphate dehydrogenase [Paralcaligenes ureilyticus]
MMATALPTDRTRLLLALAQAREYDMAVIGGGATGLGVALDAALRGLSVVLLESHDFAKGTSSRATKLVHGGVRYLAQGNIALVREALHERTTLLHNAPHLARPLAFVMPSYKHWETPFYGIGLKIYDALAGKAGLGATQFLSAAQTELCLPGVKMKGLKGGVKYWDGQFDDARLALALARTAATRGALLVNYCTVTDLLHEQGRVVGLRCQDEEFGTEYMLRAKCVINAAGVWVDEIRQKDGAAQHRTVKPMVAPSQGVHLVVDRDFSPGDHAMLVPKTQDGRVLFAVPWLGKLILGTTDTPRHDLAREPDAYAREVDFILRESAKYLKRAPSRADVKSIWVGLRPLVRPPDDEEGDNTKKISREHTVLASPSGLITVTGGKWTTYRAMAEDVLRKCVEVSLLSDLPPSQTAHYKLVGADDGSVTRASITTAPGLDSYGCESDYVQSLEGHDQEITPGLTESMVRFAVRYEYARCVEDVLARRFRLLFLDARLAAQIAPRVAQIVQEETGLDPRLELFLQLTRHYLSLPS